MCYILLVLIIAQRSRCTLNCLVRGLSHLENTATGCKLCVAQVSASLLWFFWGGVFSCPVILGIKKKTRSWTWTWTWTSLWSFQHILQRPEHKRGIDGNHKCFKFNYFTHYRWRLTHFQGKDEKREKNTSPTPQGGWFLCLFKMYLLVYFWTLWHCWIMSGHLSSGSHSVASGLDVKPLFPDGWAINCDYITAEDARGLNWLHIPTFFHVAWVSVCPK